jgi:hypothetical protein
MIGRGATGELTGPDPEGSVPSTTHGETQFDQEREEFVSSLVGCYNVLDAVLYS